MTGRGGAQPCTAIGPHGLRRARLYASGYRCDRHSPWAEAGRPEPTPGPGWPAGAWTTPSPLGTSALIDNRAVASGKRRSAPQTYRAAQVAVGARPAVEPDLRVDLGQWDDRTRRWLRYPAADYRCHACGWTDSASGDAVPRFADTVRTTHATTCTRRDQLR